MNFLRSIVIALLVLVAPLAVAKPDDAEQLKTAALEALMSAPPERALPIVEKVLRGNSSTDLKERALFILGQIDLPAAQSLLSDIARAGDADMRLEAIRMIGIGGNDTAMKGLADIYANGDADTREAVLEAWLIADDKEAVYRIATNTQDPQEFEDAVDVLGAMGANEQLRALRDRPGMSEILIDAFAVAGDIESLTAMATDSSNPERQAQAIRGLGVAGNDDVSDVLVQVYRNANASKVREAALEGLMIAGQDDAVLQLFRASNDAAEKRELLETLVMMDSDAVWDVIDATLESGQ